MNRAISDFTPGSVFKPVIMALALENGYVDPDEVFECNGHIAVGSTTVRCGLSERGLSLIHIFPRAPISTRSEALCPIMGI